MNNLLMMGGMKLPKCPEETDIRRGLILRAEAFCRLTGMSPTALCRGALKGDGSFLRRVENGENFTIGNYRRINDYIDEQLEVYADRARAMLKATGS